MADIVKDGRLNRALQQDGAYVEYVPATILIDKVGSIVYIGRTAVGFKNHTDLPIWQIKRGVYSGNDIIELSHVDGNLLFDNVWDNRASLDYS